MWKQMDGYQEIRTERWAVTMEPRPPHCDRGRFIVKVFGHITDLYVDEQDGFPKYFFDETRGKLEIEAWLKCRGVWIEPVTLSTAP